MGLPDFIIAGAIKSGTTSLRYLLNQHPCIFLVQDELFLYDIDDLEMHPDFFIGPGGQPLDPSFKKLQSEYLHRYREFFANATPNQIVGEVSTTYLASRKAPSRIAKSTPGVKILALLRDPVHRTYSHYWHLVRTGRAWFDFEQTIIHKPGNLLSASLYKEQIERYLTEGLHIKCFLFEDFIQHLQHTIDEIFSYLGLKTSLEVRDYTTHHNAAILPKHLRLQLLYNRLFRHQIVLRTYRSPLLPHLPLSDPKMFDRIDRLFRWVNFSADTVYPPIKQETQAFLENLFAEENEGLSELIGVDVAEYWASRPFSLL